MVNSRKKWIRYELEVRKKYIDVGFKQAKTSRFASRMTDDKWVDIVWVDPFLPQCKNYKSNFSVKQAIDLITWIKKEFKKWIPVIHCKITEKRKSVVIMDEKDFFILLWAVFDELKYLWQHKDLDL